MPKKKKYTKKDVIKAKAENDGETLGEIIVDGDEEVSTEATKAINEIDINTAEDVPVVRTVPKEEVAEKTEEEIEQETEEKVKEGWISVSPTEVMKYQEEGILVGYNPETKQALLKKGK